MSKVNVNMDFMKNMPPDRQAAIKGRMKTATEKNYILDFNSNASFFKEEERLDPNGQGGGFNWMQFVTGPEGGSIYKDLQSKTYINKKELFGKVFLVKDSIAPSKWVLTGETKKIGIYTCYKAKAFVPTSELNWYNFSWSDLNTDTDKEEAVKEPEEKMTIVEAWYTPQIPIAQGPAEFWGLPGLILEVSADNTTLLCSKLVLNPKEEIVIKAPTKGDVVTKKEYQEIVIKKMKEYRSNRMGRG